MDATGSGFALARGVSAELWGVVLAGGQGRRLASVTRGVPKQYYAPRGDRTLLEETLQRLGPVVTPTRLVTVIDRTHHARVTTLARRVDLGRIARQPLDRGTAAGVLLGISALDAPDEALLVLTPSDHGVASPALFRRGLRRAAAAIRRGDTDVVLFAVAPSAPAGDFGWVLPAAGARLRQDALASIGSFEEKPEAARARDLLAAGGAWNTMVLVARVGAMLELYRRHLPELARTFAGARALPVNDRAAFLEARYPALPAADFSADLLARATGLHVYVWPATLGWTDLGTPERLRTWLGDPAPGGIRPPERLLHLSQPCIRYHIATP
jgi:mannose-1-phosphate guanylyltransferase